MTWRFFGPINAPRWPGCRPRGKHVLTGIIAEFCAHFSFFKDDKNVSRFLSASGNGTRRWCAILTLFMSSLTYSLPVCHHGFWNIMLTLCRLFGFYICKCKSPGERAVTLYAMPIAPSARHCDVIMMSSSETNIK